MPHIHINQIPFYGAYLVASYIDNISYGLGKTNYTMFISLFVNIVYYGIVFILYKNGVFQPSMSFIIWMFGLGNLVHAILSIGIKRVCLDKKLDNKIKTVIE